MKVETSFIFNNPRIVILFSFLLLSLLWRPFLVFIIPGILILFIPNRKKIDLIDLLIYIVGLSLAFWITAFWFLKYIPISLTGFFITITALTILLSVYFILKNKTSYKISLRYYNFLLITIFLFFLFLRLIPYFTLIAPAGADMSMHTYTTELIVRADGVPKNYRPILAIDTFNAFPQGFRTISAIISLLGKVPAYRATFILTCLTYFFLTAFLFLFLKKYASWQFSFISATAFSFFTVNPQGFASWGGNPTIFALVFLILFLVFLDRIHDNKFFILFASFALAATFLIHTIIFVSAAYIVGFSYLVYFLLNKEYRNYKFLNYFAILAIFFILCLPFLININLKEITPEILNWIKNWVRNNDSDWRGTILNSIYTIPIYLKERVFGTHLFQYALLICLLGLIIMFFKYFKKDLMYFIFLVLCTALVLNTRYWVLPLSYLIYPERIAVFIIIPMSIFFAFGLEQSFLYLEQKNLNKKILSSLLVLGFILTIAATIFFNKQNYVAGITSQTAITKEDMSAMAWLEKNTGQNDVIENNYGDAGLWISAITFRPTITVHAELIFLNKNIQLGNPRYVYVGKKCVYDCPIKNDFLSKNHNYKMMYDKDGVYIYKIINKPGT